MVRRNPEIDTSGQDAAPMTLPLMTTQQHQEPLWLIWVSSGFPEQTHSTTAQLPGGIRLDINLYWESRKVVPETFARELPNSEHNRRKSK